MLRNYALSIVGTLVMVLSAVAFVSVAAGQQPPDVATKNAGLLEGCGDVPEAVVLAEALRQRGLRLENYVNDIERRKRDLDAAQAQLTEKLIELRKIRQQIAEGAGRTSQQQSASVDQLIAVYDQMKPEQAGTVLSNLPPDFAAEILMRLRPDAGAKIMAAVEPTQAALLTSYMAASRAPSK